jgi:site-specific DNA-methyltransferase (cytosine-N4-specific)
MTVECLPPHWKLQPFERDLAVEEASVLAGAPADWQGDRIRVATDGVDRVHTLVERLGLSRAVLTSEGELPTTQALLEVAAGGGRRKVTSHALHGLHPYKGKFYPQLARALLNVCDVRLGDRVLDPFAGCGTTILEAALVGVRGIGLDANPLATLVSETKLRLLSYPVDRLAASLAGLARPRPTGGPLPDEEYLQRWFPAGNLAFLRSILSAINELDDEVARDAALVVLSSVMREGSFQDPNQLRVYRRKDGQVPDLGELFRSALDGVLEDLEAIQGVAGVAWKRAGQLGSRILDGDSRRLCGVLRQAHVDQFDAVITSPPYANALPYVDTDRLSLRAFALLPGGKQRIAEQRLIGNREVGTRDLSQRERDMRRELTYAEWVPAELREVLQLTQDAAREETSGFRKKRTPALLYSYFRDMRAVLRDVATLVRPSGPIAIVIGDNEVSGPGGTTVRVPTADLIALLAEQAGLRLERDLSKRLTSFGASSTVHQRNAMAEERVLVFRAPAQP